MERWEPTEDFGESLQSVKECCGGDFAFKVHWCCFTRARGSSRLFVPLSSRGQAMVRVQNLAGSSWSRHQNEYERLLDLMNSRIVGHDVILDRSLADGAWGLDANRENEQEPVTVGDVSEMFAGASHEFYVNRGDAEPVLGVWQSDAHSRSWLPEVSVCRSYPRKLLPESFAELKGLLVAFLEAMRQDSIYVQICACGLEHGWILTRDDQGGYLFDSLGSVVDWHLACRQLTTWTEQVEGLLGVLESRSRGEVMAWSSDWLRTVDEHVFDSIFASPEITRQKGIGASFSSGPDGLKVSRSGSPRFLLEPYFEPVLPAWSEGPISNEGQFPILLSAAGTGKPARTMEYALYREDPVTDRCLCGSSYPRHGTGAPTNVVALRRLITNWIVGQYGGGGARATKPWPLLSSPHFYYSARPNSIREPGDGPDREARVSAAAAWRDLLLALGIT